MSNTTNQAQSLDTFKTVLNYLLDNNATLVKEGKSPIAVGLEAEAGIGKTSIVEQVAKERGMTYRKISLTELEEVGDLTGFPVKEFYVKKQDSSGIKGGWVTAETLQSFVNRGYTPTNKTRLSYATPAWLPEANPKGCILNLDDYTRAGNNFLQATMELINTGKFHSWSLPDNTSIVLTSNPDNGEYTVNSLDSAQKTRFINFTVKFDIEAWAKWAEKYELDNRAINFALSSPEMFKKKNTRGEQVLNPRSYVTFCNAISGIKNWEAPKNLAMILSISKGCFNDCDNVIGTMFTNFISQGMDKIVSPREIFSGDWEKVKDKIVDSIYVKDDNGNARYMPARASVLSTRIINYCFVKFDEGIKTEPIQNRLIDIVTSDVTIFTEDILFNIIRKLTTTYRGRCNTLITHPVIGPRLIKTNG